MKLINVFLVLLSVSDHAFGLGEVIFALNAGGEEFTDSLGIRYRRDHLAEGVASDYGKMIDIKRTWDDDRVLYDTERYHTDSFGYTIPMPSGDGDYVLWLKFCEVWFNAPNQKVFDVAINDAIVVQDLDIFKEVGRGIAHDEVVAFQVRHNKIIINGKSTKFNNEIRVEFLKGPQDNPKINAIIVLKGLPDQIPPLPEFKKSKPLSFGDEEKYDEESDEFDQDEDDDDDYIMKQRRDFLNQKGAVEDEDEDEEPKKPTKHVFSDDIASDPYASDDTYLIPILVAIGAFIPLLFCLCKL